MMIKRNILDRIVSIVLVFTILIMLVSCSSSPPTPTISNAEPQIITENIEIENVINENNLHEFITEEIYLQEIVVVEKQIEELLLEEETISEVLFCKSIYVPQEHIDEFANNSQTSQLFGNDFNIKPVLAKFAVGTGVIVTIVVLKLVGLPEPVASIVTKSAEKSIQFATTGAMIGGLYGGGTGATDVIDTSGRTTALLAFGMAVAGVILTALSLAAAIPSGGLSSLSAFEGIELVIAGISFLAATGNLGYRTYDGIKTFVTTDSFEIDWDNIDWNKVGMSAAESAIEGAADGYVMGAVIGSVKGGLEGYEFYEKTHTPYTKYNARIEQTPKDGKIGKWSGERGESDFVLDEPFTLKDGTKVTKVTYKNGVPDFSEFKKGQVKISNMTNKRYNNFKQADAALADYWSKIKYNGKTWTARDVEAYRKANNLTWHEMSNMESMQLVPSEVNQTFTHYGGVAEYNAMIGQEGEVEFD